MSVRTCVVERKRMGKRWWCVTSRGSKRGSDVIHSDNQKKAIIEAGVSMNPPLLASGAGNQNDRLTALSNGGVLWSEENERRDPRAEDLGASDRIQVGALFAANNFCNR